VHAGPGVSRNLRRFSGADNQRLSLGRKESKIVCALAPLVLLSADFGASKKPAGKRGQALRLRTHFNYAAHSYSVTQTFHALCLGAVLAAEEGAFLFKPVADYVNAAMPASWSECVDRAFEAVKRVGSAVRDHLKGLVVIVSAGFASCHNGLPFAVVQPASVGRVPQTVHRVPRAVGCAFSPHLGRMAEPRNEQGYQDRGVVFWVCPPALGGHSPQGFLAARLITGRLFPLVPDAPSPRKSRRCSA
jgi:hypothetical protein